MTKWKNMELRNNISELTHNKTFKILARAKRELDSGPNFT